MSEETIELEKEKETPTPGADQELEDLKAKLKETEEKNAALEKEKGGIYRDLKSEQEKRRQYEEQLAEKDKRIREEEDKDIFSNLADDEYITGKQLKAFQKDMSVKERNRLIRDMRLRADERAFTDEQRMQELTELNPKKYPIAYQEAIDAFVELANKDPLLWEQYDQMKLKPGGKPAEFAYKTAVREHQKFQEATAKKTRETLLDEMRKKENEPIKLRGGGGSKRLEDLSDSDISSLSDEELEKLSRSR